MSSPKPPATLQDGSANLSTSKTISPEIQPDPDVTSPNPNPNPNPNPPSPNQQTVVNVPPDDAPCVPSSDGIIRETGRSDAYVSLRWLLIFVFVGTIGIASIVPLLVVSFLVIRLLQFIRHGHDYYKLSKLKNIVRYVMHTFLIVWAFYFGIGFAIAERHSKHAIDLAHTKVRSLFFFNILGIFFLDLIISTLIIQIIPPFPLNHVESGLNVPQGILEIIECIVLWWIGGPVVVKYFPTVKNYEFLGLHTRKWIEVSILILIGYNLITIMTHLIVFWLQDFVHEYLDPGTNKQSLRYTIIEKSLHRKYLVYSAIGMKHGINFILNSVMLLLVWVLYFGSHLNGAHQAKKVLSIGTWTCVSVLICSVLWLIKSCVLLTWEAVAVYNRLNSKILERGKQLYFLGIIGRQSHDFFDLLYSDEVTRKKAERLKKRSPLQYNDRKNEGNIKKSILTLINNEFYRYTYNNKAKLIEDFLYSILRVCDRRKSVWDKLDEWGNQEMNGLNYKDEDVKNGDEQVPYPYWRYVKKLAREVKKRAQDDLLMQNDFTPTLHGIQLVAQYFLTAKSDLSNDNYISDILKDLQKRSKDGIIKKDILKHIIVGENTANMETQQSSIGLEKKSVKHEFDYFKDQLHDHDLPEEILLNKIEAWMMEVKTIGFWKATFTVVDTQEEVMYTNSQLSNKDIVNHRTNFDWNDCIELGTASLTKQKVMELKEEIEEHLDADTEKFTAGSNFIQVLTIEDKIKLAINFRHNVDCKNSIFSECLRKKQELRSKLILHVHALFEQKMNEESVTSENSTEQVQES